MRSRNTTIKDIAKALGVSASTVSRALKDHPDIAPETKRQVNELAKTLKYKPNPVALSLKNQRSNIIAVLIPEIVHHFFSTVISGIESVAEDHGYRVMISQSFESYEKEKVLCEIIENSFIEGLIISVSKETSDNQHLLSIAESGIPIVFFDRVLDTMNVDRIVIDDYAGAYQATKHLLEQGCKEIIHFAGPSGRLISRNRIYGYKAAITEYGLPFDESRVIECDNYNKALENTQWLIDQKVPFDAIFAVNDLTAIGAIHILKKNGLRIPTDVAVVGFGNDSISELFDPSLTSVQQPGYEMGRRAMELLMQRIESNVDKPVINEIMTTSLVVRQSSLKNPQSSTRL
jgi:LacI family transcriptional regulator